MCQKIVRVLDCSGEGQTANEVVNRRMEQKKCFCKARVQVRKYGDLSFLPCF